jgi:hypothetical protein
VSTGNSSLVSRRRKRLIIEAPGHHVRPQPRKSRAVATSLVSLPNPEEGEPLPLFNSLDRLASKAPGISVNHPGPRSPVWAMPDHGGPLRLQVLTSHRCCGVDRVIQPGSESTMNPDPPSSRKTAPTVVATRRHSLELCAIPRPIHRSTSHGLTPKGAKARNGQGACEATVVSRFSRVSRAWFVFPRPLFLFLCWSWFLLFFNWFSQRCQPFHATHPCCQG